MKNMKKWALLIMLLGAACALLVGCNAAATTTPEAIIAPVAVPVETAPFDVEIREKMFVAQSNDVYANIDEYIGKAIKLEGMFRADYYEPTDSIYYQVYRNGPGCCGTDGLVGFEVSFPNGAFPVPRDDDWVEAVGTLAWYDEDGQQYLTLNLASLKVLDKRGAETVTQ